MITEPLAVTIDEAARLLSQSAKSVERWIASGRLKSVKRGRSRRIRMDDLKAFNAAYDETVVTPVNRRRRARPTLMPLPAYDGPMPLEEFGEATR